MTTHPFRATIKPIVDGAERPLWSVLIPTFNCGNYLRESLRSVLVQDPGEAQMEIIVIDDHSTLDDPESVVREVAGSRARFIRQERNIGKVRNYETGLSASRGHLIHQLHGDDRVLPGFYSSIAAGFDAFPEAGAFFCVSAYIDQTGRQIGHTGIERDATGLLDGWLEKIVVQQRVQTPSMVLRRSVYESLGAFDQRLPNFEDWEMWVRVATRFAVGFVPEPLAEYRISDGNTSTASLHAGTQAAQIRDVFSIVAEYLTPGLSDGVRAERNREVAQYLTQLIPTLMGARRPLAVARLWRDVLSFSMHPRTLYRLLAFTARYREYLRPS